jgi:hypothetical protein
MKSIALIVWLISADGHQQVVARSHFDTEAACAAKAQMYAADYKLGNKKTRHLCHAVVEEFSGVDENGNPITALAAN